MLWHAAYSSPVSAQQAQDANGQEKHTRKRENKNQRNEPFTWFDNLPTNTGRAQREFSTDENKVCSLWILKQESLW